MWGCGRVHAKKNFFVEMLQNMSVHKPGRLVLIASVCKPFGLACDYTPNRKNSGKDFLQGGGTACLSILTVEVLRVLHTHKKKFL